MLEHDPEEWEPVFFPGRSCSNIAEAITRLGAAAWPSECANAERASAILSRLHGTMSVFPD
jgi:hypothetical protein